jgi:hypothetical protein
MAGACLAAAFERRFDRAIDRVSSACILTRARPAPSPQGVVFSLCEKTVTRERFARSATRNTTLT